MTAPHRIPPHAIDRPELRRQLDAGIGAPLSLIVAPAGAGKTVLLAQWAHTRRDIAVAWLDITSVEDSVVGFAQRLVGGISAAAPWFCAPSTPVLTAEGRLGDPFLEELAANLADSQTIVLVFDDLDRLSGSAILTDLWRLVDLLPENAHAVFSSRVDLHLGWSRHRLLHGLLEIRQRELAFDNETTAKVLAAITGRTITDEAAAAVTARTEGWAAGVQLTALGLRLADDPDRIVDVLTETDRLVVDYLSEEVFDALDDGRRETLMRLAVLDEVCAGLVEAVAPTRDVGGVEFLARLERDSLFIVPVPGRVGWYRFHRLFRTLLVYRLRAEEPEAEARVLEAAAEWCLAERHLETAVELLLRAHRWDRVLDVVLRSGRDVYEEVRTSRIARWLSLVPADVRASRRDADLLLAMAEGMSGHATRAGDRFQALIASDDLTTGQRQVALTYLAAEVQFHPHPEVFLNVADRALSLLGEYPDAALPDLMGLTSRSLLLVVSQVSRARAHLFLGRLQEAREGLVAALGSGLLVYAPYRVHALGTLALVDALSGRLASADEHADEALATAHEIGLRGHPAPADAYLARAVAAVQRGAPDAAALAVAEGRLSAASNNRTQLMWIAHLVSQSIHHGGLDEDLEPTGPPSPLVRDTLAAVGLRRSRMQGAATAPTKAATSWSPVAFEEVVALLTIGPASAARARLEHFESELEQPTPIAALEFELLHVWLLALENRRSLAREHLAAALAHAEPERLVHPFVRVGPVILALLDEIPRARSEFGRFIASRVRAEGSMRRQQLVDELTPRELELLPYLPSRFTIADIADRCFVSTNTIKTHLGHIYRKLGVESRDAAIERAVSLGLLDPSALSRAV